jgi:hypothetical protein
MKSTLLVLAILSFSPVAASADSCYSGALESAATQSSLGKLHVKSAPAKVEGQEFVDQELEASVKDVRGKAKKFTLVENESEAEFVLTVIKRETKVGQPNLMSHRTPRNVSEIHATLSVKERDTWIPGVQLSTNGCCRYWSDGAAKIVNDAQKWVEQRRKREPQ